MRPIEWHLKANWHVPKSLENSIPIPKSPQASKVVATIRKCSSRPTPTSSKACMSNLYQCIKRRMGAHLGDFTATGLWSLLDSKLHNNFLELKVVLLALKHCKYLSRNQTVLIATDNTTLVAYINKEGGMKSGSLCALLWRLIVQPEEHCATGPLYTRPVELDSRQALTSQPSYPDRMVSSPWDLLQICRMWHTPQMDLFVTRFNRKLSQFMSPVLDKEAYTVDPLCIPTSVLVVTLALI